MLNIGRRGPHCDFKEGGEIMDLFQSPLAWMEKNGDKYCRPVFFKLGNFSDMHVLAGEFDSTHLKFSRFEKLCSRLLQTLFLDSSLLFSKHENAYSNKKSVLYMTGRNLNC